MIDSILQILDILCWSDIMHLPYITEALSSYLSFAKIL